MHFLRQLADRQAGLCPGASNRIFNSTPSLTYLPESAFDSLQMTDYYHFLDTNETAGAPPLSMQIAGDRLALANDVGDVVILNKNTMAEMSKFTAHRSAIFDLKWRGLNINEPGPAGASVHHFITCSGDRCMALWDAERPSFAVANFYHSHLGSVKSVSFHDENLFASGGRDGSIKFWDIRSSSTALKVGPEFEIIDPHIHALPSVKSTRSVSMRRSTKARQSPIASAFKAKNYLPSNVVTCVGFEPSYNHHLYSSGISDSTVKVWDIRKCRRLFQCSYSPTPVKLYSIKQCTTGTSPLSNYSSHGFSSFTFQHSPKYGNVLLASATDHKIYSFLGEMTHPVMIYSGRYANHYSRLSTFGNRYLLSGGSNGRALLWRADLTFPSASSSQPDRLLIENRLPIYELQFSDAEDISLITADLSTATIYTTSDSQFIYKLNFYKNDQMDAENMRLEMGGTVPTVARFTAKGIDSKVISLKCQTTWNSSRGGLSVGPIQSSTSAPTSVQKPPLGLITNWVTNCAPEGPQSEPPKKRLKTTPLNSPGSKMIISASATIKKRIAKRTTRRSLFSNNRKISDFFLTP